MTTIDDCFLEIKQDIKIESIENNEETVEKSFNNQGYTLDSNFNETILNNEFNEETHHVNKLKSSTENVSIKIVLY